jgi:hypothetical protein
MFVRRNHTTDREKAGEETETRCESGSTARLPHLYHDSDEFLPFASVRASADIQVSHILGDLACISVVDVHSWTGKRKLSLYSAPAPRGSVASETCVVESVRTVGEFLDISRHWRSLCACDGTERPRHEQTIREVAKETSGKAFAPAGKL